MKRKLLFLAFLLIFILNTRAQEFSIGGSPNFCEGDSIDLINQTVQDVDRTFEWKLDGVLLSTSYHTRLKLPAAGTHTITLVLIRPGNTTKKDQPIEVLGHAELFPIYFGKVSDTTCANNAVHFRTFSSDPNVKYQLRQGFKNIGPEITGTGAELVFIDSVGVTTSTLYNIKATAVSVCFTDSLVTDKMVVVRSPETITTCVPVKNACSGNPESAGITGFTLNTIYQTSAFAEPGHYYDYSCCYKTTVDNGKSNYFNITTFGKTQIRVWIDYDNNGIFSSSELVLSKPGDHQTEGYFTAPPAAIFNTYLRMRIKTDNDSTNIDDPCSVNCGQIIDYGVKINVDMDPPVADFTKSVKLIDCQQQATFTNNSANATSFIWDFGDGSPTSDSLNPTHIYVTSGTYTVKLTASNLAGSNSTTQTITVTVPVMPKPATCIPTPNEWQRYSISTLQLNTTALSLTDYDPYKNYMCLTDFHVRAGQKTNFKLTPVYSNYCAKATIWIDYNNDGVLTSAESITTTDNTQLCDGKPVTLLKLIPETAVTNTPLRMRLMVYGAYAATVSDECGTGSPSIGDVNDFTVYIDPPLPVKADFAVEKTTLCGGEWLNCFNTSANATHYLWDFGDGETDTTESPFNHEYKQFGTFTIKLKVSNSISSDSITKVNYVRVVQGPDKPVINLLGDSLVSSVIADKYQWTNNSILVPQTGRAIAPEEDGNYQLVIYNSYGCTNYANFAYFPFHPQFNIVDPITCINPGTITLDPAPKNAAFTVNWGDGEANNFPANTGLPTHTYKAAGTYTIKVVGCNGLGCDSLTRTNFVTVYDKPEKPVIVKNSNVLSTTTVSPLYQWCLNNAPITGATASSYTVTEDGVYKLIVGKGNCTNTSDDYSYFPLRLSFVADTLSYCGVTTASVAFTDNSENASTVEWDFGDGSISNGGSKNIVYEYKKPGFYTVKLKGCNSGRCDSLILTDYIRIYPAENPIKATLSPNGSAVICDNDQITLKTMSYSGATYQWALNGTMLSVTDSQLVVTKDFPGDYRVMITDKAGTGCISTSGVTSVVASTDCVWPGDTNGDNVVDNTDLLAIGLYYGTQGIPRNNEGNEWKGYASFPWNTIQANGRNLKHVDCNGDGTIDNKDTLAIHNNISKIHARISEKKQEKNANDPVIYLRAPVTNYLPDTWVTIDIVAGENSVPVTNLYGICFAVDYDKELIQPGTEHIDFKQNWFYQEGTSLSLYYVQNMAYVAATNIDHQNRSGYGTIATLRFKTKKAVDKTENLKLTITNLKTIDATGIAFQMIPQDYSINIIPVVTDVEEQTVSTGISIYPNPYSDNTSITYTLNKKAFVNLEIYSSTGQKLETLINGEQNAGLNKVNFSGKEKNLSQGVYFLKITIDGIVTLKKIVAQ